MTRYCLVGEKLGHTLSPQIHKEFFSIVGASGEYSVNAIEKGKLSASKDKLLQYDGMNVTVPYKQDIISLLDELSDEAKEIGAVNTVKNLDGKLYGFNTDPWGFGELLGYNHIDPRGKKCVILGDGGACKSVFFLLEKLGASEIKIVTRKQIIDKNKYMTYAELATSRGDILVNATPVGMFPNCDESPIEKRVVDNFDIIVDIVYNPSCTKLLQYAIESDKKCVNGLYMLVAQAIKSQELWQNMQVEKSVIKKIYCDLRAEYFNEQKGNLFLTGMMGSGKSTVGRLLAERLNRKFFDMDCYIEQMSGKSVAELFASGEQTFRAAERKAMQELSAQKNAVIACGGGVVLDEKNIMTMRLCGLILFLNRDIKNIFVADKLDGRPLLANNKLEDIFATRKEKYFDTCDFVVDNNTTPLDCVNKIVGSIVK
ncbi:MAG: shikimate kinase [Clostridia bacterium]